MTRLATAVAWKWQYTLNSGKLSFHRAARLISESCDRDSLPLSHLECEYNPYFPRVGSKKEGEALEAPLLTGGNIH